MCVFTAVIKEAQTDMHGAFSYQPSASSIDPSLSLYIRALTCIQEARENGRWIGKTSQPCPPSSSTNDSERLQKITEGAQSIHNYSPRDGTVDRGFSICGPTDAPLAASLQSDKPAQHHEICSQPSTQAG